MILCGARGLALRLRRHGPLTSAQRNVLNFVQSKSSQPSQDVLLRGAGTPLLLKTGWGSGVALSVPLP